MLYCILGKSGSGKTTILNEFIKNNPNIKKVIQFTSRPKRINEEHGVDYLFVDNKVFKWGIDNDIFASSQSFKVIDEEEWHYGVSWSSLHGTEDKILVTNPDEYKQLKEKLGKYVFAIYIDCNPLERIERCYNRQLANVTNIDELKTKTKEITRRMICEEECFSVFFKNFEINARIYNKDGELTDSVDALNRIILGATNG